MRKFIQVDDNTWQAQGEDWTYRENHFCDIFVVAKASKFTPQRKFCVHLSGVGDSGYHYDTVVRSFDGLEHAQAFAAKLAALLSEEQAND